MMRLLTLLWLIATPVVAGEQPQVPQFINETATSGLQSVYAGEWLFMVGGGVSTFDCNDDALPERSQSVNSIDNAQKLGFSATGAANRSPSGRCSQLSVQDPQGKAS